MKEEEEIVSFLIRCAKIGYPHTRHQIMGLVQEIVSGKGIQTMISDGWWERFKKRHPSITLHPYLMLGQWHLIKNALRTTSIY